MQYDCLEIRSVLWNRREIVKTIALRLHREVMCVCVCVYVISKLEYRTLHLGSIAPDIHHFLPDKITSSPSACTVAAIFVASEEATAGSVMAKQDRIVPCVIGRKSVNHCKSTAISG